MNCRWTNRRLRGYVDGALGPAESALVRRHLTGCQECMALYEASEPLNLFAAGLAAPHPPARLGTRIRSAVSIEAARRAEPNRRLQRLKTQLDDLMRPLAVPAVGGALSALLLVGALVSGLWMAPSVYADDIPIRFLTNYFVSEPVMKMRSPYPVDRDFTVLAYIDSNGEVYDFEVAGEEPLDKRSRGQIGNALLMSQFQPALHFGQPTLGRVVILFQSIDNI